MREFDFVKSQKERDRQENETAALSCFPRLLWAMSRSLLAFDDLALRDDSQRLGRMSLDFDLSLTLMTRRGFLLGEEERRGEVPLVLNQVTASWQLLMQTGIAWWRWCLYGFPTAKSFLLPVSLRSSWGGSDSVWPCVRSGELGSTFTIALLPLRVGELSALPRAFIYSVIIYITTDWQVLILHSGF